MVKLLQGNKFIEFEYCTFIDQKLFRFVEEPLWHEGLPKHYIEMKYHVHHLMTGLEVNRWYQVSGHLAELKLYLHQFFPEERSWHELDDAITTVCIRNQINIYRDWMDNGLPEWDGIDRMDFLYRHAGAENREWSIVLGHSIFLGMVARCYDPGFDFRGFVILEGDENIGKTWLVRTLAFDERFATHYTFSKNGSDYEAARQLRGMVMVELADKGGIDSKTPDQIKAFLTQTHDVNRRMNKDDVEHLKRIGIFIVTCNVSGPYLKGGNEGDTRFLPIKCVGMIDVEAVKLELPQLFAQAKYLWEMGVTPRLTKNELEMQRRFVEPRQEKPNYYYWVLDMLKLHRIQMTHEWDDGFTMDEMLGWCHSESWFAGNPRTYHRRQIADTLRNYFFINNDKTKAIPVFYQTEGGPKVSRKWRYQGDIEWNQFIDSLED